MEVDVCIVGAGPVGAALACRLASAGVRIAVIDRAALPPMEHPDFDGRAYAIATGSRALLEQAGVWAALPAEPGPILDIRVSDGRVGGAASPLFLHFDHADADRGPFGWMVEARNLRMALNTRMHALDSMTAYAPATATVTREPEGAVVQVDGGPRLTCRLVVAAEGRGSPLRQAAGIPVTRLAYRQSGIVAAIAHERPHCGAALEHFLPAGPFAQLPMAGIEGEANLSAIVWTESAAVAPRMIALDDAAFGREIARRLGDHLGAIRPVGRRWLYPLGALHAHRYTDTRLVLVGDAAHGIHPIAGQGLNLGLRDAIALSARVIAAVDAGQDPGSADLLAAYQSERRPANLLMLAATHGLDRLFSTDNPLVRAIRDVGIAGVQRLPGLKRAFMRQAMGGLILILTLILILGRVRLWQVAVLSLAGAGRLAAQTMPDTGFARLEMTALVQTLNADLLSHDSATLTLERWCNTHHLAATGQIEADLSRETDKPATPDIRRDLGVGADEPVRYRRVRLSCGDRVLSVADNWYVPRLLTPEMNRLLDETATPFGRAVLALGFTRRTLAAELLWQPLPPGWEMTGLPADQAGAVPIPDEILRHRAVLTTRDGTAFSEVVETYQRAMLAFALP